MNIIKRSFFGWPVSDTGSADPKSGLVLHYDGPGQNLSKKTHTHCIEYWQGVRHFHMGPSHGWADIGYSYGVCPHGIAFEGRGAKRVQAAQQGSNSSWYSCSLMLGNGEKPTDAQIATVNNLRDYLHSQYGNSKVVKGHKDFNSTDCPGTIIYKMIKDGVFSSPVSSGPRDLGLGDSGDDVKAVQTALNAKGRTPKLKIDSDYGPKTVLAVKWFQRKNKLSPDGIVGKKTREALGIK